MTDLKTNIETIAENEGKTELEVITLMQAAAAATGNEELLDALCELKWDYIELKEMTMTQETQEATYEIEPHTIREQEVHFIRVYRNGKQMLFRDFTGTAEQAEAAAKHLASAY